MDLTTIDGSKRYTPAHLGILRQFRSVEDKITKYMNDEKIAENTDIKKISFIQAIH